MKILFLLSVIVSILSGFPENGNAVDLSKTPLIFTRNDGQVDTKGKADVRFYTSWGNSTFFFCADGVVADFQKIIQDSARNNGKGNAKTFSPFNPKSKTCLERGGRIQNSKSMLGHALKINFVGRTNFNSEIKGVDEQGYKCNYFIGNDPLKWHTKVPNYSSVMYKNVWKGIDICYYAALGKSLKYDVIVHPGANPKDIRFRYEGEEGILVNKNGSMTVNTSLGEVVEEKPYVYQVVAGKKREIVSSFCIQNSIVSIYVKEYDVTKDLIIDPVYSTFIGGTGDDNVLGYDMWTGRHHIKVDNGGQVYVAGGTSSTNFPVTLGAYQSTKKGNKGNAFISKLNSSGTALLYSTYLGGSADNTGDAIAIDEQKNVYVTGFTTSSDFPVTLGAFQSVYKSYDAFVTRLNVNGDSLLFSTYLGGATGIDEGGDIAVDSSGVYVTGVTNSKDFPVTPGAYQTVNPNQSNVNAGKTFVAKLNPTGSLLLYGTYLGGTKIGSDWAFGIAIDKYGCAYITGFAQSVDFPTTPGVFQPAVRDSNLSYNAFITKFNNNGSNLLFSTFFHASTGGTGEVGYSIAVDENLNTYIAGSTSSFDLPLSPNAFQKMKAGSSSDWDIFITKFNDLGSIVLYSSYLGGSQDDDISDISIDQGCYAYVSCRTNSTDFPITLNAFHQSYAGGTDASIAKINTLKGGLSYSTYLGGKNGEIDPSIVADNDGNVYVTGSTGSPDFPTTAGAFQTNHGGGRDVFISKFSLASAIAAIPFVVFPSTGCASDPIDTSFIIRDTSQFPLIIDTMWISGTNSTSFSLISPISFPIIVPGDSFYTVRLRFSPIGISGIKTAFLNIHSDDDHPLSDTLKQVTLSGRKDSVGILVLTKQVQFDTANCSTKYIDSIVFVKNTGTDSLTVTSTVMGSTAYTITPTQAKIAPGASQKFAIRFAPSGAGTYDGRVYFAGCSVADSTDVHGVKKSPASITVYPTTLSFDSLRCSSLADSIIIVKNTGSVMDTLDPAIVNGNGFVLISPTTTQIIKPGDSVVYKIRFSGTMPGDYNGTFALTGSPCNLTTSHILLARKDSIGIFSATKAVTFSPLACDDSSRDTIVLVTNTGTTSTIVTSMAIGSGSGSFIVQPTTQTITAGTSKPFTIRFAPSGNTTFVATVYFTDSLCGRVDSTNVTGSKKSDASIAASPSLLDVGDVRGCQTERDSIIIVKNTGIVADTLSPATVTGNGFTLIGPTGTIILSPGDSVIYHIRFTPSSTGNYSGNFVINSSPCHLSLSIPLRGTKGKTPAYVQSPQSLDMDIVDVNSTTQGTVGLTNPTGVNVRIKDFHFVPATFPGTITTSAPITLLNNTQLNINFTVTPPAEEIYTAELHVVIDSPCVDEVVYTVKVEAVSLTACAEPSSLSTKSPGEVTTIPIILENTNKVKNADSVNGRVRYDPYLIKVTDVTTTQGTIESYYPQDGEINFTVKLNRQLATAKDTIASLTMMALLAPRANGMMSVTTSTFSQGKQFSSRSCPTNFTLSESCIHTGQLQKKNVTTITGIYPNPSREYVMIEFESTSGSEVSIKVYDIFGREMSRAVSIITKGSSKLYLETKEYPSGLYHIVMKGEKIILASPFNVER